jgi:hypothetical protein
VDREKKDVQSQINFDRQLETSKSMGIQRRQLLVFLFVVLTAGVQGESRLDAIKNKFAKERAGRAAAAAASAAPGSAAGRLFVLEIPATLAQHYCSSCTNTQLKRKPR